MSKMAGHCGPWRGVDTPAYYGATAGREHTAMQFVPPVDIYEDEQSIALHLEIPGVNEKEIKVELVGATLTVSGERKLTAEAKPENFRRVERGASRFGEFQRAFRLPPTVESENVSAEYENGMLKITLAKKAELKPKTKTIAVNHPSREPLADSVPKVD